MNEVACLPLLSIFVVFPTGKTINDFNEKWLRFRPGDYSKMSLWAKEIPPEDLSRYPQSK